MPQDQRIDICDYAYSLIEGVMDGRIRIAIIKTVMAIAKDQRKNVCACAQIYAGKQYVHPINWVLLEQLKMQKFLKNNCLIYYR